MAEKRLTISAQPRTLTGRKVRALRRLGQIPANVFGKKIKSQSISISLAEFQKAYKEVGETGLIDVLVAKDTPRPCLISDVHIHPVTDLPLHVDFHQVDLTQKVTANVPVEIIGEAPVVKEKGAVLITLLNELEVEALPTDLPEKFSIDISGLQEFNQAILVKDIPVNSSKITIKNGEDEAIVKAQEPKEEEVPVDLPAPAPAEEGAPAPAAGATPAEGEPKPTEETKPKEEVSQS